MNLLEAFVMSLDRKQLEAYAINQRKALLSKFKEIEELEEKLKYKQEELDKLIQAYSKLVSENVEVNEKLFEMKKNKPNNTISLTVKASEIDEVKDIIASFIFMLEDTRIDRDIRLQYLETCKNLKESYYVRIDK